LTLLRIREETEVAVVEMGISDFGEMHRLSKMAKPTIAVITNIGQCHLENLKSRDGILKAKTEIFDYMAKDGYVVLNGNDDKLSTVQNVNGRRPWFFGLESEGVSGMKKDVYATETCSKGLFGSDFKMHIQGEVLEATVPLPGQHMVVNALAAACVGKILGMDDADILAGISVVQATGGRSNIIRLEDKTVIDDCYNANPVSMKSAVDLLMMANGPKCVILGDMFELGTEELALHREVGQYAALARLDKRIFIGELAKEMYEGAMKLRAMPEYFPNKEAFFAAHQKEDFADMTVLVKASHGMHFEEIVEWLR
jgi:UDP-N-acetylmuramoyl-tripeptide--D-alanyl-D-alanine ligase